jgi:hypothetical protein
MRYKKTFGAAGPAPANPANRELPAPWRTLVFEAT